MEQALSRRTFIKHSALATSAVALSQFSVAGTKLAKPSERINLAGIGIGGRGGEIIRELHKTGLCNIVALCDVEAGPWTEQMRKDFPDVPFFRDFRQMFDKMGGQIDAVTVGTPDFSHFPVTMMAIGLGKHVYVEKPIGNSVRECETMVAAARRHNAIVQVGQWQRSQQHFKDAMAFVHSGKLGKLGKVRLVKAWAYQGWMKSIPVKADEPVPPGVHYDRWLGPAKKRPFNPNRFHFEFRWFWDYAGGLMTDWGVHMLDYALIGMKVSDPKSVMAAGGKFAYPDDAAETPDTLTTVFEFDGFNIQWEHANGIDQGPQRRGNGVSFIGNNGTLVVDRGGWEVIPEGDRMEAVPRQKAQDNGLDKHMENFVEAIRKKDAGILNAPVEAGAHIATFCQLGNIAYKTGKKLYWDRSARKFTDSEANRYLAAAYHNGYKIPEGI